MRAREFCSLCKKSIIFPTQGKGKGKGKSRPKSLEMDEQTPSEVCQANVTVPKLRCLDVFAGCGGKFKVIFFDW